MSLWEQIRGKGIFYKIFGSFPTNCQISVFVLANSDYICGLNKYSRANMRWTDAKRYILDLTYFNILELENAKIL